MRFFVSYFFCNFSTALFACLLVFLFLVFFFRLPVSMNSVELVNISAEIFSPFLIRFSFSCLSEINDLIWFLYSAVSVTLARLLAVLQKMSLQISCFSFSFRGFRIHASSFTTERQRQRERERREREREREREIFTIVYMYISI